MKKVIALFCAVILVLLAVGCGSKPEDAEVSKIDDKPIYSTEYDGDYYKLRSGFLNAYNKIIKGEDITIAFIGGSITYGIGTNDLSESFRVLVENWLEEEYGVNVTAHNLAIPSACSGLGAYCIEDDVLSHCPDIVFIEYAINDKYARQYYTDEEISVNMETIVRKIYEKSPSTDVALLYTTSAEVSAGEPLFLEAQIHEEIAEHYGVASINIGYGLRKTRGLLKMGAAAVDQRWLQFFTDGCHTNKNGNTEYAKIIKECIAASFEASEKGDLIESSLPSPKNKELLNTQYIKTDSVSLDGSKGFKKTDKQWDVFAQYPNGYIYTDTADNELVYTFKGSSFGILGSLNTDLCYSVDGGEWVEYKGYNSYPQPIVKGLENKSHTIKIKAIGAEENQFSIMAFLIGE